MVCYSVCIFLYGILWYVIVYIYGIVGIVWYIMVYFGILWYVIVYLQILNSPGSVRQGLPHLCASRRSLPAQQRQQGMRSKGCRTFRFKVLLGLCKEFVQVFCVQLRGCDFHCFFPWSLEGVWGFFISGVMQIRSFWCLCQATDVRKHRLSVQKGSMTLSECYGVLAYGFLLI